MTLNTLTAFLQKIVPHPIYFRIKPLGGLLLELLNWKVETLNLGGTQILAYADYYFPNIELAQEIKGYFRHYTPKKGDVVIDAGAYSGLFTVTAAKLVGDTGKVIAYEPDPYNRLRLKRNLWLNKIHNVTIRPFGLYSDEVTLKFEIRQVASRIAENLENPISVEMKTFDNEVVRLQLSKINMVKMDIEGAEIEVLKGSRQTLKKFKSTLHWAIASYHVVKGKCTAVWLEKYFAKNGYNAKTEYPRHKTTYAFGGK